MPVVDPQDLLRERDELRAKVERHQAEFREQITAEHAEIQQLHREIERLRAALAAMDQAIAGHPIYETSALQSQVLGLLAKPTE